MARAVIGHHLLSLMRSVVDSPSDSQSEGSLSRMQSGSVRRPRAVLGAFVAATVLVGGSCGPLPPPEAPRLPFRSRYDSVIEARARDSTPAWRASHYFMPNLHGPFPRPTLPAGGDSNDAVAYYRLGDSIKFRQQGVADRALYWAIRLDPTMANAYYDRWDLRTHGSGFFLYPDDTVRLRPRTPNEATAVDSLRFIAFMYDPFLDEALDIPPQIRNLKEWQADRDARTSGLWAYAMGNYAKAVKKWGEAMRKKPENAVFHVPRAYAWIHLQETDSAVADFAALIARIEKIQDSTVAPYLSKDFLYYAIGMLRGGQKRYPEARAAYEGAVSENLGFYMAHVRLAAIDLLMHDTTLALNELETASLMRNDDPVLLAFQGEILMEKHQLDEADVQLNAALHADSDYALPYAFLGEVAEQRHDTAKALSRYREFLARASQKAVERPWVTDRVVHLTGQVVRK